MKNPFYHSSEVVQKMREGWELVWIFCDVSPTKFSDFFLRKKDLNDFRFVKVHKNIACHLVDSGKVCAKCGSPRTRVVYQLRESAG